VPRSPHYGIEEAFDPAHSQEPLYVPHSAPCSFLPTMFSIYCGCYFWKSSEFRPY
jgi:hypothetical protein